MKFVEIMGKRMSLLGSLVSMILSYLVWSVFLPLVVAGMAFDGAKDGIPVFFVKSSLGAIVIMVCSGLTAFILSALGEPLTNWSYGWPGYLAFNLRL